jgi:hypothetical protein
MLRQTVEGYGSHEAKGQQRQTVENGTLRMLKQTAEGCGSHEVKGQQRQAVEKSIWLEWWDVLYGSGSA